MRTFSAFAVFVLEVGPGITHALAPCATIVRPPADLVVARITLGLGHAIFHTGLILRPQLLT